MKAHEMMTSGSFGVLVEGFDNTLQSMRIANVVRGMAIIGGGTALRDIHPLFTGDWKHYDKSFCFWYRSEKGMKHVAFESVGKFEAHMNDPTVWFMKPEGRNALLKVGKPGGSGFLRNPRHNALMNDPESVHEAYSTRGIQGSCN